MRDLLDSGAILLVAILVFGFRERILAVLKRFDARNAARRRNEVSDRQDRLAHYRHTLSLAEEQVEEIGETTMPDTRTGSPVTRYLFEGEMFASRDEAEAARNETVIAKARAFYKELPAALARRGDGKIGRD
jgi:hypothetical protein